MLARVALVLSGVTALPAIALAGEGDASAIANYYSSALERQFLQWHIWTTGVSRLDDGTLFGLVSVLLALSFACSGLGIILFKDGGLRFRGGWMVSLPIIVGSMILYATVRPYPTARDMPSMLLCATLASLFALFVARMVRGSMTHAVERPVRKIDPDRPIDDRRMKMAVRPAAGAKRVF
ncbi:MAG TPA: hypothetical protein PKA55_21245 [Rhodoblastus sp.]|nr:hypothetical protein [Rhodoblastus sp.]